MENNSCTWTLSASCIECHKDDHAIWAQSKHAHAWETIQAVKARLEELKPGLPAGVGRVIDENDCTNVRLLTPVWARLRSWRVYATL